MKRLIDCNQNPIGSNLRPRHQHWAACAFDNSLSDVAEERVSYAMMHVTANDQQSVPRNGDASKNLVRQTSFDDYLVSAS